MLLNAVFLPYFITTTGLKIWLGTSFWEVKMESQCRGRMTMEAPVVVTYRGWWELRHLSERRKEDGYIGKG